MLNVEAIKFQDVSKRKNKMSEYIIKNLLYKGTLKELRNCETEGGKRKLNIVKKAIK